MTMHLCSGITRVRISTCVTPTSFHVINTGALNVLMAATASATAAFVGDFLLPRFFYSSKPDPTSASAPLLLFAKPAVTCALASPLGYMALNYIPFPLGVYLFLICCSAISSPVVSVTVILAKSSKPIPVMLIGIVFYRKSYPWYKHVGTMLLCGGIVMFSYWKQSSNANSSTASVNEEGSYALLLGLFLVIMNLLLDGKTAAHKRAISLLIQLCPQATPTMSKSIYLRRTRHHHFR